MVVRQPRWPGPGAEIAVNGESELGTQLWWGAAMSDQKPPRMARDERTTLSMLLRYQRESFVRKVTGLDDGAARRALVGSGTTLLWLTKHLSRAEVIWVLR